MTTIDPAPDAARLRIPASPLEWRRQWLAMDRNPAAIAFAQTFAGQVLLHAMLVGCLLAMPIIRFNHVVLVAGALALCWAFPNRRLAILSLTGVTYFLLRPFKLEQVYGEFAAVTATGGTLLAGEMAMLACGLVFMAFSLFMILNIRGRWFPFASDRPLVFMFALVVALTAVTVLLPDGSIAYGPAWIALAYLSSTYFLLGYVLIDERSKNPPTLGVKLGFLRPFWAGFAPPFKGPAFVLKHEAKDDRALAVSRLKAVKLVVWALILFFVWEWGFNKGLYGALGLPRLDAMILANAAGEPTNLAMRWLAIGIDFMSVVIYMGAAVHGTVATIRMAGFAIPRGMVRPLEARTIAEFWGRYLFYFKEMLVDFFFYPAFRRWFRDSPKLRIAFATFCAAFIGNILFDMIHVLPTMALVGPENIAERYLTYSVYAGILTIGVIWSQMAAKPQPEDGWLRHDVLPRVQVIGFFALLQVVDDSFGDAPLGARLIYYASLVGVTP